MNKYVFALFCFFFCIGTTRAQRTICLQTKAETRGIGKTIPARGIEETQNGVKVTYLFNNIILHDDPLYAGATMVKIDGFWPNYNVGEPAVLSRWDTFVVPDAGAKVVVSDSSYVEFPMELSPARPLLFDNDDDSYTKDNVIPITSFRGFFPSSSISATRNDNYRGQHLLDVCVTPVQYDYVNKKIRVFTMIQYNLQYNVSALEKSMSRFSKERLSGNTLLENMALNLPSQNLTCLRDSFLTDTIFNKYLIVSVPKYATAVNKFAEWKKTLGFDVQIEMRETWDTITVKNVVSDAYRADSIKYLLIIGGQSDVPSLIRSQFFNLGFNIHPTDLYYGCMSDSYTPDIFRGRLLVNTNDEAMTVVDKIINYEKNPVSDEFFYKRGVHCAYFQDRNIYTFWGILTQPIDSCEDRRYVLTSEILRDSMLRDAICLVDSITRVYYTEDSIFPTHWNKGTYADGGEIPAELQKNTFLWDGDSTDIRNCINQKAFYVLMRGHGEVNRWVQPSYTCNDISNLNNGNCLPVVFSLCCLTGKFNESNCFCESFLKKENGGCVAIYGATQVSLSGPSDVLAEGMFDAIWPSLYLRPRFKDMGKTPPSYSPTPIPTFRLGQILDQGLRRSTEAYLNNKNTWYPQYTSELFHCFGDPSMMIYTEKPRPFTNATVNRQNNGMISVDTGGILATISFYNRRTGDVRSYMGYSASCPSDLETIVCISAHNMIPLIVEAEDELFIQNQTLTDSGYYEAKTIKVGKNVTTTQPQGDVIFSQGSYRLSGKRVELHPGTRISVGSTMEIRNR